MPNAVLERLASERERINEQIDEVLATVATDERDPTDAERELIARQRSRLEELEPQIIELIDLEERRADSRDARSVLHRAASQNGAPQQPPSNGQGTGSEVVYRTFAQWARDALILRYDQVASRAGMGAREAAQERITRQERAVVHTTTADIPGLLPPEHIAQIMQIIDRERPVVSISRQTALNSGKLTYPFITQRPTVGVQATEKTETPSQALKAEMRDITAETYLGAGNLSWQAINWSTPDALGLWFDLMAEAYANATDAAACALLEGVTAEIPVPEGNLEGWMAGIVGAAGNVYQATGRTANAVAAGVDVGFGIMALVSAAVPVFITGGRMDLSQRRGNVAGLTFVIDKNLGDNTVVVGDYSALLCAETPGAPVELRAVEPSIGGMEVGVIGAFACKLIEDEAFCKVTGAVPGP